MPRPPVSDWPQKCPHCHKLTNEAPPWVRLYYRLSEERHSKRVRILRQREVADLLGVSRQRAHQVVEHAIKRGVLARVKGSPPSYRKTPMGCVMYSQWRKADAAKKRSSIRAIRTAAKLAILTPVNVS